MGMDWPRNAFVVSSKPTSSQNNWSLGCILAKFHFFKSFPGAHFSTIFERSIG